MSCNDGQRDSSEIDPSLSSGSSQNAAAERVSGDVTRILMQIESGDPSSGEKLLPLVYEELRKLATAKMIQENPGHTLQATGLVHEAYIRLMDGKEPANWDSRGHFFAAAAEAMRRILIDNARRKQTERHGGKCQRLDLLEIDVPADSHNDQLVMLDDALSELANVRPQAATLVKLRVFAGLTIQEAALAIGTSHRTARRLWVYAQAWMRREMESDTDGKP